MTPAESAKLITFGEFVVFVYDVWGEPRAGEMVNIALDTGLVAFPKRKAGVKPREKSRIESRRCLSQTRR
ncbi:MAG: hypothetical protein ACI8UO_006561 [Verrucomicrobiales bacterium]|jgi:hypothetical protein